MCLITATMSLQSAFLGSLIADAVSMPVHWYYDVKALDRDYGDFDVYLSPRNPHPDSILWRSSYNHTGPKDDILHNHSSYWGKRGVHYHQSLAAGENTLNLKLACELFRLITQTGNFCHDTWLQRYADVMLTPGWHNDTYAEEYHRAFFGNYASGKKLKHCGISDYHIGGLSLVPALLASLEKIGFDEKAMLDSTQTLVKGTHNHPSTLCAADEFARILIALSKGGNLQTIFRQLHLPGVPISSLQRWENLPDRQVVGRTLSTACYLPESFKASLHFAWKYSDDFSLCILSNAKAGGDNCHRGVVAGAIVGVHAGVPPKWLYGLRALDELPEDMMVTRQVD